MERIDPLRHINSDNRIPINLKIFIISEPGIAGVKRHVLDIINQALDNGISPKDLTLAYSLARCDSQYPDEILSLKKKGVRCVSFPSKNGLQPVKDTFSLVKLLFHIHREEPDIVHCHSSKAGFLGRLATALIAPKSVSVFTPNVLSVFFSKSYYLPEYLLAKITDRLVAASKSESIDLTKLGIFRKNQITPIPLCVPVIREDTPKHQNDELTLMGCGRICRQKQSYLFFKLALRFHQLGQKTRFVWIGDFDDGDESQECRQLVSENPDINLVVTGWLDDPNALLKTADVFCMFSRYESFGYVTADAMSFGIPVIGTNVTGTVDLIENGVTGFIVPNEIEAILDKALYLVSNQSEREKMGLASKIKIVNELPLSRMWFDTFTLYQKMIQG